MSGVSPYKLLLICFCFVSISSFFLQNPTAVKPRPISISSQSHPSLGFANNTGPKTTGGQVTSFIDFVNSGSIYFRVNDKAKLDYISKQMNKAYMVDGFGFSIIQQASDAFNYEIFSFTDIYASVAPGVDKIIPYMSYMFLQEPVDLRGSVFLSDINQKGSGIDSTMKEVIENTIIYVESSTTCTCYAGSSKMISDLLYKYDGGIWNVFCGASSYLKLNVFVNSDKYIYTKPKNCYYGIYDISG